MHTHIIYAANMYTHPLKTWKHQTSHMPIYNTHWKHPYITQKHTVQTRAHQTHWKHTSHTGNKCMYTHCRHAYIPHTHTANTCTHHTHTANVHVHITHYKPANTCTYYTHAHTHTYIYLCMCIYTHTHINCKQTRVSYMLQMQTHIN